MKYLRSWNAVSIFILTLTTALVISYVGQMPDTVANTTQADAYWYQRTAEAAPGLDPEHRQPFAYRLLGPYLVGILPIPELQGFRIVSIACAFALVFLYYYFLRDVGLSIFSSLLTVILLLFNRYVFGQTLWTFTHVNDFLMMIILVMMLLAIRKDRWLAFGVTLVLGAMTREPTMLMIPVAFFYLWEKRKLSSEWRTVLFACIPGLVTLILIRLFVPISEGRSLTLALATFGGKLLEPSSLFRLLINTFLPLTLIPFVYPKTSWDFIRSNMSLIFFSVLVFGTTLFGSNQERLMAPAFITFYLLLGTILERVKRKGLTLFVLLAAVFLSSLHYNYGNWQLPYSSWTRALTLGSTVIVTLYMALFERKHDSKQ